MASRESQPNEPLRGAGDPPRVQGEGSHPDREENPHLNDTLRNIQNTLGDLIHRVDRMQQPNRGGPPPPPPPSPPRMRAESSASATQRENNQPNPQNNQTPSMLHLLREFRKIKPPTFSGDVPREEDPTFFLLEVERLLEILDCPSERYVELTSFQLGGTAKEWYDTYKTQKEMEAQPLIWREFSTALKVAFMPHGLREEKAREFEQLKQGNMTVMEYKAKFLSLARYAPHLTSDSSRRVYRFVYGLRDGIARSVPTVETTTMDQAVSMAITAEARFVASEQRQNKKVKRTDTQSGNFTRRPNFRFKSQRSASGTFNRRNNPNRASGVQPITSEKPQQSHNSSLPQCKGCGRYHRGDCFGNILRCFTCGQIGHYSRDCPAKTIATAPIGSSAPSVNKGPGIRGNPGGGKSQAGTSKSTARVFALDQQEAQTAPGAITGTLSIGPSKARVIFDSGATRSFVSKRYVLVTGMAMEALPFSLIVTTPLKGHHESNQYVKECAVLINGVNFPADLIYWNHYN